MKKVIASFAAVVIMLSLTASVQKKTQAEEITDTEIYLSEASAPDENLSPVSNESFGEVSDISSETESEKSDVNIEAVSQAESIPADNLNLLHDEDYSVDKLLTPENPFKALSVSFNQFSAEQIDKLISNPEELLKINGITGDAYAPNGMPEHYDCPDNVRILCGSAGSPEEANEKALEVSFPHEVPDSEKSCRLAYENDIYYVLNVNYKEQAPDEAEKTSKGCIVAYKSSFVTLSDSGEPVFAEPFNTAAIYDYIIMHKMECIKQTYKQKLIRTEAFEDESTFKITLYYTSYCGGDWGLSDVISLVKDQYTINKQTGKCENPFHERLAEIPVPGTVTELIMY